MPNVPNTAEWITAVSAAAGVVVSIALIVLTRLAAKYAKRAADASGRLVQVEQKRDDRQEERDARAQAEQVAAWLAVDPVVPPPQEPGGNTAMATGRLYISNASRVPVWDVRAVLTWKSMDHQRIAEDSPRDTTFAPEILAPQTSRWIDVRETGHFVPGEVVSDYMLLGPQQRILKDADDGMVVHLYFRDAANQHWRRGGDGVLVRDFP